jgi:hypothetical protein
MFGLSYDPIALDSVIPGSVFKEFVDLGDGCVALKRADGKLISQVPNEQGKFEYRDGDPGAYETFGGGVGVGIKTSWTRPHELPPDKIYSYFAVQLPNV